MTKMSKKLILAVVVWAMSLITFSYVLSALDKNVNEGSTVALITTVIGALMGYMTYKYKLKDSRNKHGICHLCNKSYEQCMCKLINNEEDATN